MDDRELQELQERLYKEAIEVPEEQEQLIIDVADSVANQLYLGNKNNVKVEFYEHKYAFGMRTYIKDFKQYIHLLVIDAAELNAMGYPRTFHVETEINNDLSMLENVRASVAAFLRDSLGELRAELMDDDE